MDWKTLRTNDVSRKENHVRSIEAEISISSDHNSDLESSDTSSEPAKSCSKESTLPAKHNNDNEETPLKKTQPRPCTSKKEVLETIKKLYFKCGGDNNLEHLYILPLQYIYLLKYESISDKIYKN